MIVEFDKSFYKSIDNVKDTKVLQKTKSIITTLEKASSLKNINNIKKLTGFKKYYRIRIGNYRLGLEQINKNTIRLILITHRKDIYRKFP